MAHAEDAREAARQEELTQSIADDAKAVARGIVRALNAHWNTLKTLDEEEAASLAARAVPADDTNTDELAARTHALFMRSVALGMQHGMDDKPRSKTGKTSAARKRAGASITLADKAPYQWTRGKGIPFAEAEDFLKAKIPLTREEWDDLEPKLRFRAFMVSRLATHDAAEVVRRKLLRAVQNGQSAKNFIHEMTGEKLSQAAGMHAKNAWYWNTVYRTNIHGAYSAGRMMANEKEPRPLGYTFSAILDKRTSHICKARDGVSVSRSDPWLQRNTPPLHHNCRSTLIPRYSSMDGIKPSAVPPPSAGFGGNPVISSSFWKLTPSMLKRAQNYGMAGDVVHLARQVGLTNYAIELADLMKVRAQYKNGGVVKESVQRQENSAQLKAVRATERGIAQEIAKRGYKVHLLGEGKTPGMKYPDAYVNGKVFEFKKVSSTNAKNIAKVIYTASKEQSENVLVQLDGAVDLHELRIALVGARSKYLKELWVLHNRRLYKWRY